MIESYKMRISYLNDNKLYASSNPKTGHYVIDEKIKDNNLIFTIKPSVKMEQIKFSLVYEYNFDIDARVFPNGYQSWTDSRELSKSDKMPPLTWWANETNMFSHCRSYGDYNFALYNKNAGYFHGCSYAYIRNGEKLELFGSLNERTGYTILYFDMNNNQIIIEKELEGLTLTDKSEYEIMNLFYTEGGYDEVFDKYFEMLNIPTPRIRRKCGYTSWYNYYSNITEDIIKRDLESLTNCGKKIDIFQIDDGYQTAVGDWKSINADKFPNGMKAPVDLIHSKDMLAGLWLAPLNAQKSSKLYHEHKDWFIHDDKGNIVYGGANWGGFYTLNFYKPEVRNHLKDIFNTVLNEWGYDMVKLDFLYSACVVPFGNKTRGEIMCDAMDFIRECVGLKLILGCGVPLFPAFGKVDFCRTGCDVSLDWKRKNYFNQYHREDVSTENSLMNSIFRRHLDGRAFCNDPDVFLLRENNIAMDMTQRSIIAKVNKIFGNLLFISDNISDYTDEQRKVFEDVVTPCDKKVIKAEYVSKNEVNIVYSEDGVVNDLTFDIVNGKITKGSL